MDKKALLEKISAANKDVDAATDDLDRVIREIAVKPRAEKTTIASVVEDAFSKLRAAKGVLGELERLVEEDD